MNEKKKKYMNIINVYAKQKKARQKLCEETCKIQKFKQENKNKQRNYCTNQSNTLYIINIIIIIIYLLVCVHITITIIIIYQ